MFSSVTSTSKKFVRWGQSPLTGYEKGDQQKYWPPFVELMGIEPTTPCLQSRCSSQLSYSPVYRSSVRPPTGEETD